MNWTEQFAQRTRLMRRSAIRELLKVGSRPGVVSLAGGLPAAELFPTAELEAAAQKVLRAHGRKALQYGETEGLAPLRDWLAANFPAGRAQLKRENILLTTGAQQGLDLIGRILLNDRDKVIVENPTYLAALSAWRPLGVEFLPAPTDGEGLCVDALDELIAHKPKLLYTTPNFQNPTGITLPASRRRELVKQSIPIVEDNPYGDLWYDEPPPRSLFELSTNTNIIYLGTFSKILAPSLRVGWVIAAEELIDKLALAKQSADLQSSTFTQYIALEMMQTGFLGTLPKLRAVYRERRDAMLDALGKHFPEGAAWTRPAGGLFVWVTLPVQLNSMALLSRAVENNVTFVPGEDFHADNSGQNTLRLNFSNASIEDIRAGIARLGAVIQKAL